MSTKASIAYADVVVDDLSYSMHVYDDTQDPEDEWVHIEANNEGCEIDFRIPRTLWNRIAHDVAAWHSRQDKPA